jgi:hypothetical protein
MKKTSSDKKISIVLLMALLCFSASVNVAHSQTDGILKSEETLSAEIFITDSLGGTLLIRNIVIRFSNVSGPPLNYSLPAFNEYFRSVNYAVMLGEKFWISLQTSYNTIDIDMVEKYADEICNEFLKAFNLDLSIIDKTYIINNKTNSIMFYHKLGYFGHSAEPFEELTKYKPADGFGQLITRQFIDNLYYHGNPNTGLVWLNYTLNRVDQSLLWSLVLGFTHGETFKNEDHIEFNLNELLGHSGSITPLSEKSSKILIKIFNSSEKYLVSFESSSPPYSSKEEYDYTLLTYDLTTPIENLIVQIEIHQGTPNIGWFIIIVMITIGSASAIVLIMAEKRKRQGRLPPSKITTPHSKQQKEVIV